MVEQLFYYTGSGSDCQGENAHEAEAFSQEWFVQHCGVGISRHYRGLGRLLRIACDPNRRWRSGNFGQDLTEAEQCAIIIVSSIGGGGAYG